MGGMAGGRYAEEGMTNYLKRGYCAGIGFEWGPFPFSLEIDALYFLKTNSDRSRGWDYEMREVSVPVMAKFRLSRGLSPYAAAGVEGACILSHKQIPGPFGEKDYDMTDLTRRLEFGLVFGAGVEVDLGAISLNVEGRYHHGLTDTTKFTNDGYDFKTREYVILAGIKFFRSKGENRSR